MLSCVFRGRRLPPQPVTLADGTEGAVPAFLCRNHAIKAPCTPHEILVKQTASGPIAAGLVACQACPLKTPPNPQRRELRAAASQPSTLNHRPSRERIALTAGDVGTLTLTAGPEQLPAAEQAPRQAVCDGCEHYRAQRRKCGKMCCSVSLPVELASPNGHCPLDLWPKPAAESKAPADA